MLQMAKNLLATWETWIRSVGREDPLEKEMATHSSILAWKTPRAEEPGGLQSMGLQRIRHNLAKDSHLHFYMLKSGIAGSYDNSVF